MSGSVVTTRVNAWVPALTLSFTIVASVVSSTWFITRHISNYEQRLSTVEQDAYTLTAASEKALRTAIENPQLRVPDPRDPSRIIQVRAEGMP
ncbi:MAG: hypothetical protein AAGA55_02110 [Planctomycetota bacterium]